MSNIKSVQIYYNDIISKYQTESNKLKNEIFRIGSLRLAIFIICCFLCYYLWGNTFAVICNIVIGLIFFLGLMKYHNTLFYKRSYSDQQVINAKDELSYINYDFSAFDGGSDKINAEHSFSLDLDLFGERSFFQSINRSVTSFGKDALANNLIHPFTDKQRILNQQDAIKELSENAELLSHFKAIGGIKKEELSNNKPFINDIPSKPLLANSIFWKSMLYLIPSIHIIAIILINLNILVEPYYIAIYVCTLLISTIPMNKVSKILQIFDHKAKILGTYSELMKIIENQKFKSETLLNLQNKLRTDNRSASASIKQLNSYYTNLLISKTFPVALFFNPYLCWAVRYAIKIENWTKLNRSNIDDWFDALAKFDSLVSLATFAFNNPSYTYPTPANSFIFEGKALGHPMLHRDSCVRNDISMKTRPYFLVITGANMAGKSTYLRTIGVNHTLGSIGAPVCADSLTFYPQPLVTNLRTADSLADNESYFYAELKRLKMIIDRLDSGEELFIILDEILKGTNSEDKQKGSIALMKQLISLKGNGIIATHDLVLGQLEYEYPEYVKDFCFEAEIAENNLTFSYKIREGIAQNMNACFLMKKMGITGL